VKAELHVLILVEVSDHIDDVFTVQLSIAILPEVAADHFT